MISSALGSLPSPRSQRLHSVGPHRREEDAPPCHQCCAQPEDERHQAHAIGRILYGNVLATHSRGSSISFSVILVEGGLDRQPINSRETSRLGLARPPVAAGVVNRQRWSHLVGPGQLTEPVALLRAIVVCSMTSPQD